MNDDAHAPGRLAASTPRVGICVLNFHQPEATRDCVASLLQREPPTTRVLWLENDADANPSGLDRILAEAPFPWVEVPPDGPLPGSGVVGIIRIHGNLGYARGNNVGLRLLEANGLPYAWVVNNDTRLVEGSSSSLVEAALARPGVGIWGSAIVTDHFEPYYGGVIRLNDYKPRRCGSIEELERDPLAFVSGCSLFMRTETAARVGFIPDDYFLYYEDPAFSLEAKKLGFGISALDSVRIWHHESLSVGDRSDLKIYYNARNRWAFIRKYFPEALRFQARRRWYRLQSLLFRGRLKHTYIEWLAYRAFRKGETGRNSRISRQGRQA